MAATREMLNIAKKFKPDYVCLVPEKRKELTTEGGLNIKKNKIFIKKIIKSLKKQKTRVSLFIEPIKSNIKLAKSLNVDCIELHTGKYCDLLLNKKSTKSTFKNLQKSAMYAKEIGLEVHAGHGLTYVSAFNISKIKAISELNIGHFLIADALFIGLAKSIKKFKSILNN